MVVWSCLGLVLVRCPQRTTDRGKISTDNPDCQQETAAETPESRRKWSQTDTKPDKFRET